MSEHEEWETAELAKGICPYSGLYLGREGEQGPDSMSCVICDCFGFPLDIVATSKTM